MVIGHVILSHFYLKFQLEWPLFTNSRRNLLSPVKPFQKHFKDTKKMFSFLSFFAFEVTREMLERVLKR